MRPPTAASRHSRFSFTAARQTRGRSGYCNRLAPWIAAIAKRFDVLIVCGVRQYHGFAQWQALHMSEVPRTTCTCAAWLDPWFKEANPLKQLKKWSYWPCSEYRELRDARTVIFPTE
jgi:hypothetical protein